MPDPALARIGPVPESAPPYDDQSQASAPTSRRAAADKGTASGASRPGTHATTQPGTHGTSQPGTHGTSQPGTHGTTQPGTHGTTQPGPDAAGGVGHGQRGHAGGSPAQPTAWPSKFAQALAETLAGSRPSRQLTPWTTQQARARIRRLGPLLAADQQPRVRRVVASTPSAGVVEMAVVVGSGPRVHALAVRLERSGSPAGNGWLCTAIEAA